MQKVGLTKINIQNVKDTTTTNKVLPQWGLTCFYETFVLKQTVVLLLNFGSKNPPLRQYPNRPLPELKSLSNNKIKTFTPKPQTFSVFLTF